MQTYRQSGYCIYAGDKIKWLHVCSPEAKEDTVTLYWITHKVVIFQPKILLHMYRRVILSNRKYFVFEHKDMMMYFNFNLKRRALFNNILKVIVRFEEEYDNFA